MPEENTTDLHEAPTEPPPPETLPPEPVTPYEAHLYSRDDLGDGATIHIPEGAELPAFDPLPPLNEMKEVGRVNEEGKLQLDMEALCPGSKTNADGTLTMPDGSIGIPRFWGPGGGNASSGRSTSTAEPVGFGGAAPEVPNFNKLSTLGGIDGFTHAEPDEERGTDRFYSLTLMRLHGQEPLGRGDFLQVGHTIYDILGGDADDRGFFVRVSSKGLPLYLKGAEFILYRKNPIPEKQQPDINKAAEYAVADARRAALAYGHDAFVVVYNQQSGAYQFRCSSNLNVTYAIGFLQRILTGLHQSASG